MMQIGSVRLIIHYPAKSMQGIALDQAMNAHPGKVIVGDSVTLAEDSD